MRITFDRAPIFAAVSIANSVVPSRTVKPVLQNVLLSAVAGDASSSGECYIVASDTEITASIRVPVKADEPGEVLLPSSRFHSILRESRDSQMRILANSNGKSQIKLKGDGSSFDIPWCDPAEFPRPNACDTTAHHAVNAGKLRDAIQRTIVASDSDNSRYALHSILFEFEDAAVTLVATDGRRMAVSGVPAAVQGGGATASHGVAGSATYILLPQRAAGIVARAFSDDESEVRIAVTPNEMLFTDGTTTIVARRTEGRFPSWRQVIPEICGDERLRVTLSGDAVLSAVRQATVVADSESRSVRFVFKDGSLEMRAQSQAGRSTVKIPAAHEGERVVQYLDSRYATDFFRSIPGDGMFLWTAKESAKSPAYFIYGAESSISESFRYLLMPMESGDAPDDDADSE